MAAGITAFGQNAPVRGVVKIQKADGTTVPAPDIVVEAYRTDIDKGKMPAAKTNKRGEFGFVGFPLGQRYVIAVSGPGIAPAFQPDVRAGMENIELIVSEGDGRPFPEAEVRAAAKGGATPEGGAPAIDKKQAAELAAKNAEILKKNEKIQADDETARRANTEG